VTGNTILLFSLASLALLIAPGPVVLFTVARSIQQGRPGGFASTLGVSLGDLAHVLMATVGLSALLLTSALAFSVVKFAGAAYLIYLGLRALTTRESQANRQDPVPTSLSRIFSQGVMVGLLNVKTALFFVAFLPQFVDPSAVSAAGQILLLGSLFVLLGMMTNVVYVVLASSLGGSLKQSSKFSQFQRYFSGSVYLALGITTALVGTDS
jgi:threonine/homoserine/homoserine lactone efflux protein